MPQANKNHSSHDFEYTKNIPRSKRLSAAFYQRTILKIDRSLECTEFEQFRIAELTLSCPVKHLHHGKFKNIRGH